MSLPKYMTDPADKTKHKKSQKQEKRVAAVLGGKVQRGSGSKAFHKGDVKSAELLVESKRTDKESLGIKKEWLVKISQEAAAYGRIPALSIEFDTMPRLVAKDWIAVPAKTFSLLIEYYKLALKDESDHTTAQDS